MSTLASVVTFSIDQLAGLLNSLGERARSAHKPDLRAALGLVSDIGRVTITGDERDIRATQSAVGALREHLGGGEHVESTPAKYLQSADSKAYLAGAMWALSEVLDQRLVTIESQRVHSQYTTRKYQVAQLVSEALAKHQTLSPSQLPTTTLDDGTSVRRDELSRVLGTFLDNGWVHVVSGAQGRKKFFALTPSGKDAIASTLLCDA